MIANYHTHTPRCNHAIGSEEEYVLEALRAGLKILGFADHTPQFYPDGYVSSIRMLPEELPEYIGAVECVKEKYAGQIEIHTGLEVEYYPELFPELYACLKDTNVEYLLLGQHWCGNEIGAAYNGGQFAEEMYLQSYCRQVADAMQTGLFTYVAHPDLMNFVGDPAVYRQHMRWLCREAKNNAIPLELNTLGWLGNRCYPNDQFWRIAAEEGNDVIIGNDAHKPENLCLPEMVEKAEQFAKDLGLKLLQTVDFHSIR